MWVLIDAISVQEVVGTIPSLKLPRAHEAIPSVVAWRAHAVPIVDLGALITGPSTAGERMRMLVIRAENSTIAVPVDAVTEVVHLSEQELRPPHAIGLSIAVAEATVQGQLMALIDLNAVVRRLMGEAEGGEHSAHARV